MTVTSSSPGAVASASCWYGQGVKLAPGGKFAYLYGCGCTGPPVVNVTDRAHPAVVSIVNGPSGGSMDLKVCGKTAYVAVQGKGVAAYDVTSPGAPVFKDEAAASGMPYPSGITCRNMNQTTAQGDDARVLLWRTLRSSSMPTNVASNPATFRLNAAIVCAVTIQLRPCG